jgi:DNA-binding transcriptional LysR family regulator
MQPSDFNLRHLRALAATLRLGGFGAAAKAVGITQPAVTQAVARLEELTGTQLVARGPGQLAPTDAGILLAARGEGAAAALAEAFGPQRRGGIGGRVGADAELSMAQVTALLALADHGSYAAGAASLGVAQPSLHRSAASLEQLAGVALTARRGRGTALTPAGERLAAAFRLALSELQAGLDELAVLGGRDQGTIRIGAHPAALIRLIPGAIARFVAEHPPVQVAVEAAGGDATDRLRDGRLDALVTLASSGLPDAAFEMEELAADPLVIAARAGHPLAAGAAPGLVRLAGFGWALPEAGSGEREGWERMFLDGGLYAPEPGVTCPSPAALLDLVAQSDLLTIASQASVERSQGALVAIGPPLAAERRLLLVTRAGWAPTPAQATFLDELRGDGRDILAF